MTQGNSLSASCLLSETIIIIISLPMTKSAFMTNQALYIASIAKTAGVLVENIKILSVDEVSSRSLRTVSGRLLLAASVRVLTSILIPVGQQTSIKDQAVLNSNLNQNGLPSGTLVVQDASGYTSASNTATPSPNAGVSLPEAASGSATSSNIPIGAIVGGAGGFLVLLAATVLMLRYKRNCMACLPLPLHPDPQKTHIRSQEICIL